MPEPMSGTNLNRKEVANALNAIRTAVYALHAAKPHDRSPTDRFTQVCITDLEKVYALYKTFVHDAEEDK